MTATEIRIGATIPSWGTYDQHYKLLFEYFNQNYEFYGRRLVPVFLPSGWNNDPAQHRAFAAEVASKNVFAAFDQWSGQSEAFFGELANRKIITITTGYEFLLSDRFVYDLYHPYVWGAYPSIEQVWANVASFACSSLVGKPPRHAAGAIGEAETRTFGLVVVGQNRMPYTKPLVDAMRKCGAEPLVAQWDAGRTGTDSLRTSLNSLKASGATTYLCACAQRTFGTVMSNARSLGLGDAEWLTPMFSYSAGDEESAMQSYARTMNGRVFGATPTAKALPIQAQPYGHLESLIGNNDPAIMEVYYRHMAILAAGIQMAGPNLTPETFAAGLMNAQFPNAGAGAAPFYQPSVGFGPGDHTYWSDFAVQWFDLTLPPQMGHAVRSGRSGSWCYLDHGRRFTVGQYPADADARIGSASETCP